MPHDGKGDPYPGGPYTYPELAAAGLWTTPERPGALRAWACSGTGMHPGQALLPPALARAMLTPVKNSYALGLEIEGKGASTSFGHGGSNMGYQNSLYAYAGDANGNGDGIVIMTNGDAGAELTHSIVRAAAFEYHWPSSQTVMRKAAELPAAKRKALAGTYEIKGLGTFEIADRDGRLMLGIRDGALEPLYAAPGSPTVLFVLSRELELRMAKDGSPAGRLLSGPFDVQFKRVKGAAKAR